MYLIYILLHIDSKPSSNEALWILTGVPGWKHRRRQSIRVLRQLLRGPTSIGPGGYTRWLLSPDESHRIPCGDSEKSPYTSHIIRQLRYNNNIWCYVRMYTHKLTNVFLCLAKTHNNTRKPLGAINIILLFSLITDRNNEILRRSGARQCHFYYGNKIGTIHIGIF